MPDYARIIEREFRKAVKDDVSPIEVELMLEDEAVRVTYGDDIYICDCDDDAFIFFSATSHEKQAITFPVPADYLEEPRGVKS